MGVLTYNRFMYSTVAILKNSKHSGKLVGTHQKIDKIARKCLSRFFLRVDSRGHNDDEKTERLARKMARVAFLPDDRQASSSIFMHKRNDMERYYFPTAKEILYFEGSRGPDGIKRKSPGVDEPSHFIIPEKSETHPHLLGMINDHMYNLTKALKDGNDVRAAFEAAWLAHALTDGLTPAHHFPLKEAASELMSDKEFIKFFGAPIKGIMRGEDFLETVRNNWRYWGTNGYMSKHIAFEYGVAIVVTAIPNAELVPILTKDDFAKINVEQEFLRAMYKIHRLDMYNRFRMNGWSAKLARETTDILIPEIIRVVTLAWTKCIEEANG